MIDKLFLRIFRPDKIISLFFNAKRPTPAKRSNMELNWDSDVKSEFSYVKNSKGLFILLPSMNGKFGLEHDLNKRIHEAGYSTLDYEFAPFMLSSDYKATVKNFKIIQNNIRKDIIKYKKKYGFPEIHIIGTSLGVINAIMVANKSLLVDKLTLISSGHCLAECMWEGLGTQYLRKEFEEKGISLEQLKKYWKELAPENNINGLKGKDIHILISKNDDLIPTRFGLKLINAMKKIGLKPKVKKNNLGHYGMVLGFYFMKAPFEEIFKD